MIKLENSPVQKISFEGYDFLIKRDDLLNKDFSGNKARKFHYFLNYNFNGIDTIVSHGSNQSNAMYSLSVLAKLKKLKFKYYIKHLPSYLKDNPDGNFKYALNNGMKIIISEDIPSIKKNEIFISEGGAVKEAEFGIKRLANEIKAYQKKYDIKNLKVFLPSGTGTTALYLQKNLDIKVLTCPCVGDGEYLKKQFLELEIDNSLHPIILTPPKKFHFGKLYKENYEIWQKLKDQTDIEFDFLYDPIGWQTLLYLLKNKKIENSNYIYIHQGGIIGNSTMITRYNRKLNIK
jgi:1-aminocyclopropane-1-carboxylate deaminase/D-cysteine desulfhydrase-like pyridoxal-dependent ACC family enzyme